MIELAILAVAWVVLVSGGLAIWSFLAGPAQRRWALALRVGALCLVGMLLIGVSAWQLSNARSLQLFGGIVPRLDTREPVVALTLDDGPSPRFTEEVLTILREEGVNATFFVTGERLARNPEAGQRIVEEGHELGNHSYSHQRMILKPYSFVEQEIQKTDELIRAMGHRGDIHFRAPFGKKLIVLPYYLWRTGRQSISWDVAAEAYQEADVDAEGMVEYVLEETQPGSIILMHVMAGRRTTSRQALPGIIRGLREQGYRFVTVSELLTRASGK